MTKDEFLSMLDSELENLEKEYHAVRERNLHLLRNNIKDSEYQETLYQEKIYQIKCRNLYGLVGLPAYARIQAMSDVEIEEYKKSKIEELELKVEEIESREKQEKAKFYQLKAEQTQILSQLGANPFNGRDTRIYRSQELSAEISRYDINNPYGKFAKIKRELEEVRKQQEKIKAATSQEIKQQLSAKIERNYDLEQRVENSKKPINNYREVLASVSSDSKKAQQVSNLLEHYRQLSNEQNQVIKEIYLDRGLPYELESKLYAEYGSSYEIRKEIERKSELKTNEATNVSDRLIKTVNEFEGSFEQAKKSFTEQFTEQKLFKLADKEYGVDSSKVDIDFLQQHNDKLGSGKLSHLESIVKQRDKLSKKIFKTRNTKHKIESLNYQIKQEQSDIYREIIGWYKSQCNAILGIRDGIKFYSLEALKNSLEDCKKDITRSERAIIEVKERIQKSKSKVEDYETRKNETIQQIKILGGEKYKEIDINLSENPYDLDSMYIEDMGLNTIANSSAYIHEREFVNKVQQEAQNQADIREAELRGITVEQLLQMRQQEQMVMAEAIQEEASNNMTR